MDADKNIYPNSELYVYIFYLKIMKETWNF